MKILLAIPATIFLPAGPAYVASALIAAGHQVTGYLYTAANQFAEFLRSADFDLVAAGGMCTKFNEIKSIVDLSHAAGLRVIVGGNIVSAEPEIMTRALGNDWTVIGQGETATVELVTAIECPLLHQDIPHIPGLAFVRAGEYVQTPPRTGIKDLDAVLFPNYEIFDLNGILDRMRPSDRYEICVFDHPREYSLVSSRSCNFHCSFCWHLEHQRTVRRTVSNIMDEIRIVVPKYRINILSIIDDLFSLHESFLLDFCREFKAYRATVPWDIVWFCQLHVQGVNARILDAIKDAGCYLISYGYESYSQTVLDSMGKHITPDMIDFATRQSGARGMTILTHFIFSDRAETVATARATLDYWERWQEYGIFIHSLFLYPKSSDYLYAIEKGLIKDRLHHMQTGLDDSINITKMTDNEYFGLTIRILKLNILHVHYGTLLHRTHDSLAGACPFCSHISRWSNYATKPWFKVKVICKHCHKMFWLSHPFYLAICKLIARLTPEAAWVYSIYQAVRHAKNWLRKTLAP